MHKLSSVEKRWAVSKQTGYFWSPEKKIHVFPNAFLSKVFKFMLMFVFRTDKNNSIYCSILWNSVNLILWLLHHFSLFSQYRCCIVWLQTLLSQNLGYILYFSWLWLIHFIWFSFKLEYRYLPNIRDNGKYLDFNFDSWNLRGFLRHFEEGDMIGPRSDFTLAF